MRWEAPTAVSDPRNPAGYPRKKAREIPQSLPKRLFWNPPFQRFLLLAILFVLLSSSSSTTTTTTTTTTTSTVVTVVVYHDCFCY